MSFSCIVVDSSVNEQFTEATPAKLGLSMSRIGIMAEAKTKTKSDVTRDPISDQDQIKSFYQ